MKILICSDGTPASENAIELAALLADPLKAELTLLGIAEKSGDERPLREALERQARSLRTENAASDIVVRRGEPVRQILDQTSNTGYDLVVVGARWTGPTGQYWRSERTYEVIKTIRPPVLVAIGERKQLKRIIGCTGGKEFIEHASTRHGRATCHLR
jgi:nucleotide-binding universal stress UspA family protein